MSIATIEIASFGFATPLAGRVSYRSLLTTKPSSLATVLILAFLSLVVVLERIHTRDEPLENDVAGYAVIAHESVQGRRLYSDLWERKPPLLYAVFAVAELASSRGRPAILIVNLFAALASLLAIYFAARNALGDLAGLFAALLWTVLGADLHLQANQPNAEALVNPLLTAAVAILLRHLHRPASAGNNSAIRLGLCLAAATLIKHQLAASAAILLLGYFVAGEVGFRRRQLVESLIAIATIAICWFAVVGYFALTHRFPVLIEVLAGQNLTYAGNPLSNLVHSLSPSAIATVSLAWVIAPLLLVIGGLLLTKRQWLNRRCVILWLAWAAAVWLAEALPGRLFPHYFQYWLPFWCVTGGIAAAAILQYSTASRTVAISWICVAIGIAVFRQGSQFLLSPDEWADAKYPGGNYTQQKYLGRYLRQHLLQKGETFWVAGDDVSLYLESQISPPSGLLYVDPMISRPLAPAYNQRLVADLSKRPPDLILLTPLIERFPSDAPIFPWLDQHYLPWSTPLGGRMYHLLVLSQSDLSRRLNLQATPK